MEIIQIVHDNVKQTTSGKFKITYIYTPDEMKQAHRMIDRRKATDYLNAM
ncbi:MAG: hypothetical protein PHY34_03255 [Patescibacteria group bacterium]|nr:hypothetical protein [Patescibacteria group bacterium]MDD5716108.1 hypothetical protein [Patescibacteria group bacterium]